MSSGTSSTGKIVRKGRFVKGSPEAKEYMALLRAKSPIAGFTKGSVEAKEYMTNIRHKAKAKAALSFEPDVDMWAAASTSFSRCGSAHTHGAVLEVRDSAVHEGVHSYSVDHMLVVIAGTAKVQYYCYREGVDILEKGEGDPRLMVRAGAVKTLSQGKSVQIRAHQRISTAYAAGTRIIRVFSPSIPGSE